MRKNVSKGIRLNTADILSLRMYKNNVAFPLGAFQEMAYFMAKCSSVFLTVELGFKAYSGSILNHNNAMSSIHYSQIQQMPLPMKLY